MPGASRPDGVRPWCLGAERRRLGVHPRHRDMIAAEHVGQRVRGVVARNQHDRVEQLTGGVDVAWLDPRAGAFHGGIGGSGPDRGVQIELVERDDREQHLDGAGRRMRFIWVARGKNSAGIELGAATPGPAPPGSPPRPTARYRVRPARGQPPWRGDSVMVNAANNFRTGAERIRCVRRRGLGSIAIEQLCACALATASRC